MFSMKLSKIANALVLASLLGVGATLLAVPRAHAGSAATNLSVTATIGSSCTIATAAVAFGTYDPVVANAATPLNGTGSVTIACTKGSAPSITLGLGLEPVGSQRVMETALGEDVLAYQLYQPPNTTPGTACTFPGTNIWGTTGTQIFTPTVPASKAARTYNICGVVTPGQDVSTGAYTDTVVATVNF